MTIKILLADDQALFREGLHMVLATQSDLEVVGEATNGLEAIEKTVELLPDIILMDLALPRMDGWEATRRLKMDERTRHIPIVALTGHALAGHAEGARQAGCDSFVTKPCLPDALVAEIQRMLSTRGGDSGAAAGAAEAARLPGRAPS